MLQSFQDRKNIFSSHKHKSNKNLDLKYVWNFRNSTVKKVQLENGQKTWRDISQRDIKMTDKHIRRCSTSLAAGQVKIETTRSYHVYQDAKDADILVRILVGI